MNRASKRVVLKRVPDRLVRPLIAACFLLTSSNLLAAPRDPPTIGERPAVEFVISQEDIEAGHYSFKEIVAHGSDLFVARFNALDGQGRPASTGTGEPRAADQPAFVRTSSPEANACSGCHNQPRPGGAGDFVANVFVLAQALDPVTFSVDPAISNERNTLGMNGAGAIEMLAREMSTELSAIRDLALEEAALQGADVRRQLTAKGVEFGFITAKSDGKIDPSEIEGVDWDLIVKPFHQKGAVVSIREFTNNAMNHHHGMQSVERFDADTDPDQDGVTNELTVGDITAITLFQASLNVPGRNYSKQKARREAAERGEELFAQVDCISCHIPEMHLQSRDFTEPNPFNPLGNLHPDDVDSVYAFDMTKDSQKPQLERIRGQKDGAIVRAFTDLKRWNLNDDDFNHFANEQVPQGTLAGFADPADFTISPLPRPTEEFLTRKLWDAGNTDPYGHRGDLTTLTEAIHFHGGDARDSRDAFFALPQEDQDAIIEFLKTLQVLPEGPRSLKKAP